LGSIVDFINMLTFRIVSIAWGLFLLAWAVGWLLKGAPIPFMRVKRAGQDLVEDAVWAAFWLAIGSSVFALISYIVSHVAPSATLPSNMTG
jgi:hypothetical protein